MFTFSLYQIIFYKEIHTPPCPFLEVVCSSTQTVQFNYNSNQNSVVVNVFCEDASCMHYQSFKTTVLFEQ